MRIKIGQILRGMQKHCPPSLLMYGIYKDAYWVIISGTPLFYYTKLLDVRPEMFAEATKNARLSATQEVRVVSTITFSLVK